ncbi:MAG: ribose 5-phosphate isomerase B [Sphaerochaetaceae bacterium]
MISIAVGADEAGFPLKEVIRKFLEEQGYPVQDYGVYDTSPSLYPDIAEKVALAVRDRKQDRGILVCGTGIGMAMTANKVPGIRAAQCHDPYSAERARKSNDAQIITMGARVIGPELAKVIVMAYLNADLVSPGSLPKIQRMMQIEEELRKE